MSDSVISAFSASPISLPSDIGSEALLHSLLNVSLTGIQLLRPIYAPDGATIVDFIPEYTNPAGLRMLGSTQQFSGTMLGLFPHTLANGILVYYQQAFAASEPLAYELNYQADGLDNYFRVQAQRQGPLLVISFTDTADQSRSAVELALRESQAAEQAARAEAESQRQRFYETLMALPAQVATYHGPNHTYNFVNAAYRHYFPTQALPGRTLREVLPEAEGQGVLSVMDRVYQTGEPSYQQELEVWLDFEGSGQPQQLFLNLLFHPLRDAQGRVDGLLDFSYDVTEQVLARRQVHQLNQQLEVARAEAERERAQLKALFAQAPVAIGLFAGPELWVSAINPLMSELLGYTPEQLLGHRLFEQAPELQNQGFDELMRQVQTTRVPYIGREVAATVQRQNKLLRVYFNFVYQPFYDADGQVTGLINVAVDVTEQVEARQQVEQLNQELETQVQVRTRELRTLFAQAPMAIVVLRGPQFIIEQANAQAEVIWGVAAADVLGLPHFEAIPGSGGQGFEQMLTGILETGEAVVLREVPIELARDHTGQPNVGYYNVVFKPLFEEGGPQPTGIVVIWTEATDQVLAREQVQLLNEELAAINEELRATNEELNESNTQLTRTNVDLDNFIYTASHDLKAPITNIEGLLLALQHELPEAARTGDVSQMLGMMQDAIDRFRRTIAHLTDLSRLQKEHSPASAAVVLAPVVEAVRLDLRLLLASTQGQLTVSVPDNLTVTFAEKNLRSVVYNLLSNALKYHHPDRTPRVQLRSWLTDGYVMLQVQDNGLGMDLTQGQEKLFAMFQRLHTHVEGTGVGLYMVKRILENAGGRIEVSSELGQGTTFQVYFPR